VGTNPYVSYRQLRWASLALGKIPSPKRVRPLSDAAKALF
jgi:hypothetical protein